MASDISSSVRRILSHNHVLFFLQAVLLCGRKFIDEGHSSSDEIKARCDQLQENWDELKNLAEQR